MDQLYIEQGYVDASYYNIVAEAGANIGGVLTASIDVKISDATGYYIEEYIEVGYLEATEFSGVVKEFDIAMTAFGDITMTVSVVKNQTATIDAVTNMSATASKVASNTITLESIINQSLQEDAPRIRFFTFSTNFADPINSDFTTFRSTALIDVTKVNVTRNTDVTIDTTTSLTATSNKTTDINLALETNATLSVDALNIQFGDATIAIESSVIARADSYVLRLNSPTNNRAPYWQDQNSWQGITTFLVPEIITSSKKFGTGSLKLQYDDRNSSNSSDDKYARIGPVGIPQDGEDIYQAKARLTKQWAIGSEDFVFEMWLRMPAIPTSAATDTILFTNDQIAIKYNGSGIIFEVGNNNDPSSFSTVKHRLFGISRTTIGTGWFHIAIYRSNGVIDCIVNNNKTVINNIGYYTYPGTNGTMYQAYTPLAKTNAPWFIGVRSDLTKYAPGVLFEYPPNYPITTTYVGDPEIHIDNASLRVGESTIRGLTGPQPNNEFTKFNLQFDTNIGEVGTLVTPEYLALTVDVNSALVTSSSITAVPNAKLDADTIHLGTFAINANANILIESRADILSDFSVYANAISVVTMLPAQLAVEATTSVDAGIKYNTLVNLNVESSIATDVLRVRDASVATDSVATTINVINKIGNTLTDFEPGVFSTTVSAERLRGIDDVLASELTVSTEASKIPRSDSILLESTFAVGADISYRPDVYMDDGALATLSVSANRRRDIDAVLDTVAVVEAATSGLLPGSANLITVANLSATAVANRTADASLAANTFVNSEGIKAVVGETILNSEFNTTTINSRIRDVDTQFDSIASEITAASKIGDFLITLESAFTTVTSANLNATASATIDAASTIETTSDRLRSVEANSVTEATLSVIARLTSDAALDANIASALLADAVRVADATATLTNAMTFESTVRATRNNEVSVFTESSMSTVVNRTRSQSANISSQATLDATAAGLIGVIATTTARFDITADGRTIHILELVYTIPREDRTFSIGRETRTYQVQFENREYTLGA